jgi:mevalonate kinase
MGETTQTAYQNLKKGDAHFYTLFNRYHGLMDALGVNDATLSQLVYQLRSQPNIRASKISGSGLGDCVIGLGTCNREAFTDYKHFTLNIAQQGAHIA